MDQLVDGYNCEQELLDSICEMTVYLLQKKYGENWEDYASPELLAYYKEMKERKNKTTSDSGEDSASSPEGNDSSKNFNII